MPGDVEITVYDINGHRIKHISESTSYGGVIWDLKDENGHPVSTGVYFYNLQWNSKNKLGKIAIIR